MANKFGGSIKDTVVAANLQIKGNLTCEGNLTFDGSIIGDIVCQGDVALGPNAYVEGNITAHNLTTGGSIKGNLRVNEQLVVAGDSHIKGDVKTQSLIVDEGALIKGNLAMSGGEKSDGDDDKPAEPNRHEQSSQ